MGSRRSAINLSLMSACILLLSIYFLTAQSYKHVINNLSLQHNISNEGKIAINVPRCNFLD